MLLKKLVLGTLMLSMGAAVAAESKDSSVPLRGEYKPAAGYKVYFDKDKESYLKLSGYSKLYLNGDNTGKMRLGYFRFYIDGQADKKWGFHTRLDYTTSMFAGSYGNEKQKKYKDGNDYAIKSYTPGIYFGRAYVSYDASDSLRFEVGRIAGLVNKFDVFLPHEGEKFEVSDGVKVHYNKNGLDLKATYIYIDNNRKILGNNNPAYFDWNTSRASNTPNQNKTIGTKESATVGARAGYDMKVAGGSLGFGVAGYRTIQDDVAKKYYSIIPDFSFSKGDYYFYHTTSLYKVANSEMLTTGYTEFGKDVSIFGVETSADIYVKNSKTINSNVDTVYNVGLEFYTAHTANFKSLVSLEYSDATDVRKSTTSFGKNIKPSAILYYYF